ncbi:DUF1365 domain-containing protein [Variovorax sp. OV329]|uniref:DUF1365 domain-containing protein n=1 Tax=Variovorax sp. OV329 TaxID=1882825 RepID=UPI0008E3C486|nr:DUF1365 domain-containing protein [Variovorax sp. OV329]SFN41552.1 hypothetical protein SAMN05444747_12538 [Variovorax sp. OV329]
MTTNAGSALYCGAVMHQRLRPLRHRLRYRLFFLLLDLDELPRLHQRLRFFSLNRFNLLSLHERDHGAPDGLRLRDHIDALLAEAGIAAGGPIRLLAMPRILGFAFNPLSVYLCEHPGGGLAALVYEVRNTFGERHRYVVEVAPGEERAQVLRHSCAKRFHVSPFMDMDLHYHFMLTPPLPGREGLHLGIQSADEAGVVLVAQLDGSRQPLDDGHLLRAFVTHPLLGLKVLAGIHWEALRMLLKGAPLRRHPGPPDRTMTVTRLHDTP